MKVSDLHQRIRELEEALIEYVEKYGLTEKARNVLAKPIHNVRQKAGGREGSD